MSTGKSQAICILCHIACEVPLSLCYKSGLRYFKTWQNFEKEPVFGKKSRLVQAVLTNIQIRILHVLISKIDIVPGVLCGCEIWCHMSREEHKLRVCESRLVRYTDNFVGILKK